MSTIGNKIGVNRLVEYTFIATQGQTTFTGTDFYGLSLSFTAAPGMVRVSAGGRKISRLSYSLSGNNTIIFNNGLNAGTVVDIEALFPFNVADSLTTAQMDTRYPRIDATNTYTDTQKTNFYKNIGTQNIPMFSGLKITPGSTQASLLNISTVLANLQGTASGILLSNISAVLNTATVGANGLDTGTLSANTWYYIFWISKADGTVASLLSLSATAPTLPSGYIYFGRIGGIRLDGSKNIIPIIQIGRSVQWLIDGSHPYAIVSNGISGTNVAVPVSNFAIPTAVLGRFIAYSNTSSNTTITVAPNTNYGNYAAGVLSANPLPVITNVSGYSGSGYPPATGSFLFEGPNVYVTGQSNAVCGCTGYDDNILA